MEEYLYDSLYFVTSKLHRNINRIAEEKFRSVGLAPSLGLMLLLLDEWKELSPGDISIKLDFKPSTTTRFLDKLEKLKYVKRLIEGRYTYVKLTQKGVQKIPEIKGVFEELEYNLNKLVTTKINSKQKLVIQEMAEKIVEKTSK